MGVLAVGRGDVSRTELHGLSKDASTAERLPLTLAQGLVEGPMVDACRACDEPSPQVPRPSRLRNSDVLSDNSPSPLADVDNPLKSFVMPPYVSCITENAADAFDESFPHTDFTPLFPKRSAFGIDRARAGDVEYVAPGEDDRPGLPGGGDDDIDARGSILCSDPSDDSHSPREFV